jgi:hypothetical protein
MWGCVLVRVPWAEQECVKREVTANPKLYRKPYTPSVPRYREPYDPRILANTRGEYPVSDSPMRVNTRLAIFQASHTLAIKDRKYASTVRQYRPINQSFTFHPASVWCRAARASAVRVWIWSAPASSLPPP